MGARTGIGRFRVQNTEEYHPRTPEAIGRIRPTGAEETLQAFTRSLISG
jgi:hypothetical protein